MSTFDDPFNYSDKPPEWFLELERQKKKEKKSNRLGKPIGTWGGSRPGAGRPRLKPEEASFTFKLNPLQKKVLAEMGDGNIKKGIQALIDQHL